MLLFWLFFFKKKIIRSIETCRRKIIWPFLFVVAVLNLFLLMTQEPGRAGKPVGCWMGCTHSSSSCVRESNYQSSVFRDDGKRKAATTKKKEGTGLNWLHEKERVQCGNVFYWLLFSVCLFNSGWRRRRCRRWSHARFRVFLHVTSLQPVRSVALRQLRIQRRHRRTPHQVTWLVWSNIRTVVRLAHQSPIEFK